jgi:putative flippase GtrA
MAQGWKRQELRFLVVGGCNTVSGFLVTTLTYYLLNALLVSPAIFAISTLINVTVSFLTQKLLVFRTKGNWLTEYLRFYVVMAVPVVMSIVVPPILIDGFHMNPYLSMVLVIGAIVVIAYFGHKHVSFRTR